MELGSNIKRLRVEHCLTQGELGKIAGVSPMAVSQWENGRAVPRMGAIQRMADYFGISKSSLIDDEADGFVAGSVHYEVTSLTAPVYGRISAGDALEMLPVTEEAYVIPPVAESHPDGFFLTVSGDSMDKIMPNGSLVYFDKSAEVPSHRDRSIDASDPDAPQVRILGKAVWHYLVNDERL